MGHILQHIPKIEDKKFCIFCLLTYRNEMFHKGIIKGYHKWYADDFFWVSSYTPDIGPFVNQRSWWGLNLMYHECVHVTGDTALRIFKEIDLPNATDIWQSPTLGTMI